MSDSSPPVVQLDPPPLRGATRLRDFQRQEGMGIDELELRDDALDADVAPGIVHVGDGTPSRIWAIAPNRSLGVILSSQYSKTLSHVTRGRFPAGPGITLDAG